jgi:DNA-binding IclR family transcriptional regulator
MAVVNAWPTTIITQEIARTAQLNGKETSALMAVLAARGLVERLEERRGLLGGSIWQLTQSAVTLMRLEKE